MNEILFIAHVLLIACLALGALRLGKEALTAAVGLQAVLANLFVLKQIELFGFTATCSDVFAIGAVLNLNLLQEYYGREEARKAVRLSFFSLLFFAAMSQIHLLYQPAPVDQTNESFRLIFASLPRIAAASLGVYYFVQRFDLLFFHFLKNVFEGQKLPLRMGISLIVSQLLDTILFSFFGLYGLVASLFDVIAISFLIKCLIIGCIAPFIALSKRIIRHVSL